MMAAANLLMDVRTRTQAHQLLLDLEKKERELIEELDSLLEGQTQLDVKMTSFQHMLPHLRTLDNNATELSSSITRANLLAESVSGKVRVLDLAKGHVYAAMKQVDDVIDLKSCVDGVQYSIKLGDFEKAADHIHRYIKIDRDVMFPGTVQDDSSAQTFKLLKKHEVELIQLVRSEFKKAINTKDASSVERFLKIYPRLALHQEGLDLFCPYLRAQISSKTELDLSAASNVSGQRAGLIYADVLTQVFEDIADSIEKYHSMIDSLYGQEWSLHFIQQLQLECDRQVGKVLKLLTEERALERKVHTVTMALKSKDAKGAIRPDVLELDVLLTELSLCSSHSELYFRFINRKLGNTGRGGGGDSPLVSGSGTRRAMQEMIGQYIVLENYFMSESLTKVVRMDNWTPSSSSSSLNSSMADDIFFVLQKCIKRAFSSSNVDCSCAMLNHARALLEEDYREELHKRLKSSLPTSIVAGGLDYLQERLQGRVPGTDNEQIKTPCMVPLNDVEVSIRNIQKLTKDLEMESSKLVANAGGTSREKLQSCLGDLSSAGQKLGVLRKDGVSRVLKVAIMPRITDAMDIFSKLDHILTEEKLSGYEADDPFVHQLVAQVQEVFDDIKVGLLPQLYEQVVLDTIATMASRLEQLVFTSKFNQLGGIQLDHDLRCMLGYLSSLTSWPVRDKFARLSQIATILSLQSVGEMLDYWGENSGSLIWRLNPEEVRAVLSCRVDLNKDDITRLKL